MKIFTPETLEADCPEFRELKRRYFETIEKAGPAGIPGDAARALFGDEPLSAPFFLAASMLLDNAGKITAIGKRIYATQFLN